MVSEGRGALKANECTHQNQTSRLKAHSQTFCLLTQAHIGTLIFLTPTQSQIHAQTCQEVSIVKLKSIMFGENIDS